MTTIEGFAILVRDMRAAQKRFSLGGGLAKDLRASMEFEKEVDLVVASLLDPPLPELFDSKRKRA